MGFVVDIRSRKAYPSNALSNFAPHCFSFDGARLNSMECFLQSLKEPNRSKQALCWSMSGHDAKQAGSQRHWQKNGLLYWKGISINRYSLRYWKLLTAAYDALADQNEDYARALMDSGYKALTHSVGKSFPWKTCLTKTEFLALVYRERCRCRKRCRNGLKSESNKATLN